VHRVTVDGFRMDRHLVTNRQFKEFVKAMGHVTFAEIPPDPNDYPDALPHMLYAGSLVFRGPEHQTDLRDWGEWWTFLKGADCARAIDGRELVTVEPLDTRPVDDGTPGGGAACAAPS
jgi:sulfatase modifying factor 1